MVISKSVGQNLLITNLLIELHISVQVSMIGDLPESMEIRYKWDRELNWNTNHWRNSHSKITFLYVYMMLAKLYELLHFGS